MLRIRLFGELALEEDSEPLPPPASRRARDLLAWLALNEGMHARSGLAARFWPDVLDASARASLRTTLFELRRALGGSARHLVAGRDRVRLGADADEVWVDARESRALLAAGRVEDALALARGELLAGIEDDWAVEARDRHRDELAEALGRRAVAAEAAGDLAGAARLARERSGLDPLSEEAGRELIRTLVAAGDRGAALAAYERLRDRLRTDLGIAPSAETRRLVEAVRSGTAVGRAGAAVAHAGAKLDGAARAVGAQLGAPAEPAAPTAPTAPPPLPAALARRHRSAFVGRDEPLARLREGLDAARSGERALVLLAGEPGIGKTRLAAEFCRTAHAEGATVLFGRCYEEALVPYQPFAEALGHLLRAGPRGAWPAELAHLIPDLAAEPEPAPADPGAARYRLFEAVVTLLSRASAERPVVLLLDDLHWADAPTLLLLGHVLRSPQPLSALVIGAYRDTELARTHPLAAFLADLRRERVAERVALRGLPEPEVDALIAAWTGAEAPPALARAVHAETEGNPFFIEEVLQHLAESGGVHREDGRIPEGVKEVIGRRLNRLSEATNRVLSAASAIGREFDVEVLEALGDPEGDALLDCLDEAARAQLIREEPGAPARYSFSHALVRETVYEELGAARRARLHRRIGEALERLHPEVPGRLLAQLAHHHLEAASPRALEYATRAGDRALEQLAYEEAAAHYDRALQVLEPGEAEDGRGELLLRLGEARIRAGDVGAAKEALRAGADVARRLHAPPLLARTALAYGGVGVAIVASDPPTVALLEEALTALGEDRPDLRARLLGRLAVELYYAPSRDRSEGLSAQAVEAARAADDAGALAYALNARHVALWRPDRLAERLEVASEMVAHAERAGDREATLQGHNWRALDLFELGHMAAFDAEVDAHERLADHLRLPAYRWYAPLWRAVRATLEGRWADAERHGALAYELGTRAGDRNADLFRAMLEFGVQLAQGRFADMDLAFVEEQVARSPAGQAWRTSLTWIHGELGREDDARRELRALAADGFAGLAFDANWLASLAELSEACALLGEVEPARELNRLLSPYAGRHLTAGRAVGSYGSSHHHLGLLAATLQDWARAEEHFVQAARHNDALRQPAWTVRTWAHHAAMLLRRDGPGDRERAASLRAEAREAASELGITDVVDRIVPPAGAARQVG